MYTIEHINEELDNLDTNDLVNMANEYARESCPDDEIFTFDEENIDFHFASKMDAIRAFFFGDIKNFSDEYMRLNGYGNIVTMCDSEAEEYAKDIIKDNISWYIDNDQITSLYIEPIDEDSVFVVHATRCVNNWGGYELQMNESCDAVRVRLVTDSIGEPSEWMDIEYNEDGEAYFMNNGTTEFLSDYTRV